MTRFQFMPLLHHQLTPQRDPNLPVLWHHPLLVLWHNQLHMPMLLPGVSPGSMIMLWARSKSLHPSWDPTCPCIKEWVKVDKSDFVFTKNRLGFLFHAIYKAHNKYIPFGKGDTLITKYQNPQREKVNEWLSDLNESSLSLLDIIEISNHRGEIVEMY